MWSPCCFADQWDHSATIVWRPDPRTPHSARCLLDVPYFHCLGLPHAKQDNWSLICTMSNRKWQFFENLCQCINWKFVSMKVKSFLIMTVSDRERPKRTLHENYSLNLWLYVCHVCLFRSVISDTGIPRGLLFLYPSARNQVVVKLDNTCVCAWPSAASTLLCKCDNYAATDGDTHCSAVKKNNIGQHMWTYPSRVPNDLRIPYPGIPNLIPDSKPYVLA